MKHDKEREKFIFGIVLTLIWLLFLVGVAQNLDAWYRPLAAGASRISYSLLVTIFFVLLVTAFVLIEIWIPKAFQPLRKLRNALGILRWGLIILLGFGVSSFFLFSMSQSFTSGVLFASFDWSGDVGGGFMVGDN